MPDSHARALGAGPPVEGGQLSVCEMAGMKGAVSRVSLSCKVLGRPTVRCVRVLVVG